MKSVNKNLPLISVVIPVFKAEQYLDRCIESIVNQTYRNLEIILVDDGSPDNCPQMCDAWAEKDPRIRVIHKENGGAGHARNIALDIAQGEYISLIDSDDYIEEHMYEHLLGLMTDDIDIAECGLLETESDTEMLDDGSIFDSKVYTTQEALKLHIADRLFRQTPPNKLYRRHTIGEIRFPIGNRIDDEFWTYRVLANARKLVRTSCNMYAYRQQPGSVMHLSFALARLQAVDAKMQRVEFLKDRFPELVSQANINLWYTCLYMGQMALLYLTEEDCQKAFEKLLDVREGYWLSSNEIHTLPLKQQVWAVLSKLSLKYTCKLRNCLRIGI